MPAKGPAASGSIGEALADTPETVVRLLVGGAVIWLWGGYLVWRAPRWQRAHLAVEPSHVGDNRF